MFFKMSPTIVNAYFEDPDWFTKKKIKNTIFDGEGYDHWGYNLSGIDRAGKTKSQYEHGPTKIVDDEIYYDLYEETVNNFSLSKILSMKNPLNVSHDFLLFSRMSIKHLEEKYNATFVAFLPLRDNSGNWTGTPAAVFYQVKPPQEAYSHYFAIFVEGDTHYITSGQTSVEGTITAVQAKNGEIIYSSHRHDYRVSTDQTVWIDGGRDYVRSGSETLISMYIKDGRFFAI